MKIGYPCQNWTLGCNAAKTFRLASYSEERLIETVQNNLDCLQKILEWNVERNILFFRITSDLVPFASHPICAFDWQHHFKEQFQRIGEYIRSNNIRISMHPDQFVLINSPKAEIVENSIRELEYHAEVLDLMGELSDAKIQIHVGGLYADRDEAIKRFCINFTKLSNNIKRRLVIENDDRLFAAQDCLEIHNTVGIPILFDTFHHEILNHGESMRDAVKRVGETWKKEDGIPMIDYSSQNSEGKRGKHTDQIDLDHFHMIMSQLEGLEFDVMFEIKDKEKSVMKVLA